MTLLVMYLNSERASPTDQSNKYPFFSNIETRCMSSSKVSKPKLGYSTLYSAISVFRVSKLHGNSKEKSTVPKASG